MEDLTFCRLPSLLGTRPVLTVLSHEGCGKEPRGKSSQSKGEKAGTDGREGDAPALSPQGAGVGGGERDAAVRGRRAETEVTENTIWVLVKRATISS